MHGTMFVHLRKFIDSQCEPHAWSTIVLKSGLEPRLYLPITTYPDADMIAIVRAAADATSSDVPSLLGRFGEFVAPLLLAAYRHLLKPEWRTLDILEHVEATAHRAVRVEQPGAAPPYLEAERRSAHEITVNYASSRRLCHLAKGIIVGLARHFDEDISIHESQCMHRGDRTCLLRVVRREASGS